ncbi:MAG: class I SAM-dependent methyltransferase [Marinifilaceae bacterium]|jgi:ubiquinone/menaquinone biosynthesis C-methylase UbiE|nr:class I SAM-dependent methyltransferase [Marinifilaceae bacterium]
MIDKIKEHYESRELYGYIIEKLKNKGVDLHNVRTEDLKGIDEFHICGSSISHKMTDLIDFLGLRILDLGCGLGGASRLLYSKFECEVVGVDLSSEYIRTAQKLNSLLGIKNGISFVEADVMDLDFADSSFDIVWTQHLQMNIKDKENLFRNIKRILKPNSRLLYFDVFQREDSVLNYPLPWASSSDHSFMISPCGLHEILSNIGFRSIYKSDESQNAIKAIGSVLKYYENNTPDLGQHILMGDNFKSKLKNLLLHLVNADLLVEAAVYEL